MKKYERNAVESQSNAEKVTSNVKYNLCLILKIISVPVAYLFLLPNLIVLQYTFLNKCLPLADN